MPKYHKNAEKIREVFMGLCKKHNCKGGFVNVTFQFYHSHERKGVSATRQDMVIFYLVKRSPLVVNGFLSYETSTSLTVTRQSAQRLFF